jgi:hypothetical protein
LDLTAMPTIDMNELKRRDPVAYHQRLAISRGGELRVHREAVSNARNSVERDRAQRKVDQAKADVDYHRRQAEALSQASRPPES